MKYTYQSSDKNVHNAVGICITLTILFINLIYTLEIKYTYQSSDKYERDTVGVYTILTICLFTTLYSLIGKIYNSLAIVVHKKQHPQNINLTSFCESGKNPTVDLAKLNYIQLLL